MKKWTTFYGKEIEVASLSHQHLSNIHYYFNIVLNFQKGSAELAANRINEKNANFTH